MALIHRRTHRERKEAYIKSLESEVLQLRTNEAKILQETRTLYTEIEKLKDIILQHGIELPPLNDNSALQPLVKSTSSANSVISIRTNSYQMQQLHVQNTSSDSDQQAEDFVLSDSSGGDPLGRRGFGFFRKRESNAPGAGNIGNSRMLAALWGRLNADEYVQSQRRQHQTLIPLDYPLRQET